MAKKAKALKARVDKVRTESKTKLGEFVASPIGKALIVEALVLGAAALARSSKVRKTVKGASGKAAHAGSSGAKAVAEGARSATRSAKSAAGRVSSAAKRAVSKARSGKAAVEAIDASGLPAPPVRRRKPAAKAVRKR